MAIADFKNDRAALVPIAELLRNVEFLTVGAASCESSWRLQR